MLSKNQIKLINQLNQKKYRKKHSLFIAEGIKTVKEFIFSDYELDVLYSSVDLVFAPDQEVDIISDKDLKKISQLKTPQTVLGLFKIPENHPLDNPNLTIVLDGVRDPGNLGTIIRLCDWFGIEQLVCSTDTVDCYNPKTVQATMGSLARVSVVYTDLKTYLEKDERPVYGTFMDGDIIYQKKLPEKAVIILGNEGHGISKPIEKLTHEKIAIPQFGKQQLTESLNVATATAIILNEFKRGVYNF